MLELREITKTYYTSETPSQVLKGIDISFRRNEFTSILGPSGCGKTTLLNIIGGLDKYTTGDLLIDGISTKKYSERDWDTYRNHRVGFIFQSYNLIMHQTVLANVEIAMTLSGVSKRKRRKKAKELLERVGLGDKLNKKPNQLSGGQMQRVAIARALVNDPEIILADEPTGALDSVTSIQIMDLLKEIAKDKLVIMVTHNPQIAEQYSSRIIELKDGLIVNDSHPFDGNEETPAEERSMKRTSMSYLTSLSLSLNNLLRKKGRTLLTAFAGSIGIIGIALVLSLSNGVRLYADRLEREALTDYPISIERTSFDLLGGLSSIISEDHKCEEGKVCSVDDIVREMTVSSDNSLIVVNDTKTFREFVMNSEELAANLAGVTYKYSVMPYVFQEDLEQISPSSLTPGESKNLFRELETGSIGLQEACTVISGRLPENYSEVVIVTDSDNAIPDSISYALNVKDKSQLAKDIAAAGKDNTYKVESTELDPEAFLGRKMRMTVKAAFFREENGVYADASNDPEFRRQLVDAGTELTVVGVVSLSNSSSAYIGYTPELTSYMLEQTAMTDAYRAQHASPDVNIMTLEPFDGMFNTFDSAAEELGIADADNPDTIQLYPKNYESKQKVQEIIDQYNKDAEAAGKPEQKVSYSDMIRTLVGNITNIINIISYVLIAFIAISLIVSSIMIGIITYISVLERTKEIGILRAIGASRKDIVRLFRAETVIEGLTAGVMGIVLTLLLNLAINLIFNAFTGESMIASLPPISAVILIALSVVLNVIAGTMPSRIAAGKNPVEALRTE
ncbi:MAG: ATP-binding cassette domain-containing protein [Solobacterium sp.]|nr:ATP-binding cassette domain-containing protein [Solobacterium sp.]